MRVVIAEVIAVKPLASVRGGICLVGHSQIDFWNIDSIRNHKVRNCGIAGISSLEYYNDFLTKNLLDSSEDIYLVMHGTNDIVYETDLSEIIKNIVEDNQLHKREKARCHDLFPDMPESERQIGQKQ